MESLTYLVHEIVKSSNLICAKFGVDVSNKSPCSCISTTGSTKSDFISEIVLMLLRLFGLLGKEVV